MNSLNYTNINIRALTEEEMILVGGADFWSGLAISTGEGMGQGAVSSGMNGENPGWGAIVGAAEGATGYLINYGLTWLSTGQQPE